MECRLLDISLLLKQPVYRHHAVLKELVKALQKIAGESQSQIGLYVSAEGPQPVSLPLPAESSTAPHTISDPATKTIQNDQDRHVVPGPIAKGAQLVDTSAIGADVALQIKRRAVSLEVGVDETMTPNPAASASLHNTNPWPWKQVVPALLKKLLDISHEKQ